MNWNMEKIIGVTELQRHFRSVLDEVVREHVPHILARGSRPEAVLISYVDYQELRNRDETDLHQRFDEMMARLDAHNEQFTEAEVNADVAAAEAEVAQARRRGHKRAGTSRDQSNGNGAAHSRPSSRT
jgi:prevent-host-death family protein